MVPVQPVTSAADKLEVVCLKRLFHVVTKMLLIMNYIFLFKNEVVLHERLRAAVAPAQRRELRALALRAYLADR